MDGPRGQQSPVVILPSCPEQKGRFLIDRENSSLGGGTGATFESPVHLGGVWGHSAWLTTIPLPKR